jgi:hypothetical protein
MCSIKTKSVTDFIGSRVLLMFITDQHSNNNIIFMVSTHVGMKHNNVLGICNCRQAMLIDFYIEDSLTLMDHGYVLNIYSMHV